MGKEDPNSAAPTYQSEDFEKYALANCYTGRRQRKRECIQADKTGNPLFGTMAPSGIGCDTAQG